VRGLNGLASIIIGGVVAASAAAPAAQRAQEQQRVSPTARAEAESRYQIGQMERVLEGAVEHGVAVTRDRLQAVLPPGDTQISSENASARGFRLEGYGVFFDVIVPSFETETTLAWSVRTLDQNDLGLESALKALQAHVKTAGDTNLEQALRRVELQVNPAVQARQAVPVTAGARNATGSAAAANDTAAAAATTPDPILSDPNEAYRTEVTLALKDAMLEHSSSLGIAANEWLTIAGRGSDVRPRLAPADSDARTRIIRLRGSDLLAYLARQITKEEALQRIEVRVF
jgi:exonuclease VII small subunit